MKVFLEPKMKKILLGNESVITESSHTIEAEDGGFWNNNWGPTQPAASSTRESGWTPNY